jgi:hypothetical protein
MAMRELSSSYELKPRLTWQNRWAASPRLIPPGSRGIGAPDGSPGAGGGGGLIGLPGMNGS